MKKATSKLKLLDDVRQYLFDLEEILPNEDDFLQSKPLQYAVAMLMLNIINKCIDLGSHIVSVQQLGFPETYGEIFAVLEQAKIIPPPLARDMKQLVGLRNIIAHQYGTINQVLLYEQASSVHFVNDFLMLIIKKLP